MNNFTNVLFNYIEIKVLEHVYRYCTVENFLNKLPISKYQNPNIIDFSRKQK